MYMPKWTGTALLATVIAFGTAQGVKAEDVYVAGGGKLHRRDARHHSRVREGDRAQGRGELRLHRQAYAQIQNGAPFWIFLAADSARPEKAEAEGLAVAGSRFTYAKGKLTLWSPTKDLFTDGAAFLKEGDFNHVAIANPKTAPYGLAAQQALEKLKLWDALVDKRVQGDTIAQAFQFVFNGNAEVGFVAGSQVVAVIKEAGPKGADSVWDVPESDYAPIVQQAVLLKKGEDKPGAAAFIAFLKGEIAKEITTGYGYAVE
ncbi:molybdate ABC transporter substrate-binding protein [Breoghania sp.]|uniref:molybdate ABC transporter substrate-binding protein n=1 Tax=Breoghania sp. TaxID=2065378 RepID=UPI0026174318|nr:molybdate ABC transporter substrate-binding protein [Breoghania sp.]MDJ0931313.1 molybdate ABC transporter substrate-binding protein [Breoghania sp.]